MQIITPLGALTRTGQKQLVKEASSILAEICGDPSQVRRTWVLLTEAAEGGWGIAGVAYDVKRLWRWRTRRARPALALAAV